MAETDSPLKRLVQSAPVDFAAWLLNAEVIAAHEINIELPADVVRVDQLYRVTLANGRVPLLHIEFQGRSSRAPMPLRMLDYITRIVTSEPDLDLLSVVIYVGQGAGASEHGSYQINAPDGTVSLQWSYKVIHLWKMQATELLALQQPALLPLIGLTQINQPEKLLPQVVESLKQVEDVELQNRLFASLTALLDNEELLNMLEKLIDTEGLLMDTPFLRRIRTRSREEGREEGRRESILDLLVLRFDPSASLFRTIEKLLAPIDNEAELERLFAAAVRSPSVTDFHKTLQDKAASVPSGSFTK
jgi:predicted transposase YdaD